MLYYENARDALMSKSIACRLDEFMQVKWSGGRRFEINLVATNPFWQGQAAVEVIAQVVREFYFPTAIPVGGMSFGMRHKTLESVFENVGNVESGFVATLRARGGSVVNPSIRNEVLGRELRLNYTMQPDDEIVITSNLQEKRVIINGQNGFRFLDAGVTRFFYIQVGTNRIGYRADENVGNLGVGVRYIPNFTFAEG